LKLSDNTLVVFTSDNGGVGGYLRAGVKATNGVTDNAPLRGGKGMLYEGGVRIPYVFRWPGTVPAGKTCDVPINSVDLYPTLLELSGAKPPKQPLDGTSYVKVIKGDAAGERPPLYWHFPGYLGAGKGSWRTTPAGSIREGDWKLLEFFEDGRRELYNLAEDVGEKKDRAKEEPARVKALHDKLLAWRKDVGAKMPTKNEKK
jgi:arylsulfatase A-like enzyme